MIGLTAGAFDLFHAGHTLMLEEAKQQCDYLIVCLQTNPTIDRPETKNKPIQSTYERYVQLKGCRYVDEVIPYDTEDDLLVILSNTDFDVRILGNEYSQKYYTGEPTSHKYDVYFNSRDHNFSTSELRKRICHEPV